MKTIKNIFLLLVLLKTVTPSDLAYYLEIAKKNNPALAASFSVYQASNEMIAQSSALNDLQLDAGIYTPSMEMVNGKQIAQFQLMQMFPWFGTRRYARTEAERAAGMAYQDYRNMRDQLFFEVSAQYYTLSRLNQQVKNKEETKQVLLQLKDLALQTMTSGVGGAMAAVLSIETEIMQTDNEINEIISQIGAKSAQFNALLGRAAESFVEISDSLKQVEYYFPDIIETIKAQNPSLAALIEEEAYFLAKTETDKRKSYPMIGLGLQYMLVGHDGEGHTAMFMPMLSLSLPIYRNNYRSQQRVNAFMLEASRKNYTSALNMLEAELIGIKSALDNASRKILLYRRQAELANTIYELVLQEFISGKTDLTAVLRAQRQVADYKLMIAEAVSDYNIMTAEIERLISTKENI